MDLARDTPVRLVPYPFARLNGALLLEISDKEALVCLRRGARPQVLAELRRVLGVPVRVTAMEEPVSFKPHELQAEKIKVLSATQPIRRAFDPISGFRRQRDLSARKCHDAHASIRTVRSGGLAC